jgi:hypothetical protein
MATFSKFQDFSEQLIRGKHQLGSDVFKVMLTNVAPAATNTVKTDITEIGAGNGYTAGGTATTVTVAESGGTTTVSGSQVVFTAAGGSIGPFRYAVLYNDTQASPAKPLVAYWDYGSNITLNDTDTFTLRFNNTDPGTIFTLV